MMPEAENQNRPTESEETAADTAPQPSAPEFAGKKKGMLTAKLTVAFCLAAVAALAGIFFFTTTSATQKSAADGKPGFAASVNGPVLNSTSQPGGRGEPIAAIGELNALAEQVTTVFLVIPGKDNGPAASETGRALAAAEKTLNSKGISTGIYTLKTTSPDYPGLAAKMTPPGVVVLSKGAGMGFVSGAVSEENLLQAYSASSGGGCGSGGCKPGGCPPQPTAAK